MKYRYCQILKKIVSVDYCIGQCAEECKNADGKDARPKNKKQPSFGINRMFKDE